MQDIRPRFVSAWVSSNAVLANVCPVPKPNRLRAKTRSSRDVNPALAFSERRYFTINLQNRSSLSMSGSIRVITLHMNAPPGGAVSKLEEEHVDL
jgi:anaerobic glycerol-3-phosphate dehydrogenase